MESIEASGRSIEDAILQALARLGRRRDEVDVAVLQEPARGTRGMGAREARVRVTVKPPRRQGGAVMTPEMADAFLGDGGEDAGGQREFAGEPGTYADQDAADARQDAAYGDENSATHGR